MMSRSIVILNLQDIDPVLSKEGAGAWLGSMMQVERGRAQAGVPVPQKNKSINRTA
jgi:hypothetical protein